MTVIVVDPDDGGCMAGIQLPTPPSWKPTPIRDKPNEPIDPAGECYVMNGQPYLLFSDWDYAEDWSGEFVREIHPFAVLDGFPVEAAGWWQLVRRRQAESALTRRVVGGPSERGP